MSASARPRWRSRAAAAVALAGKQVAIVAPTTVLVRQHLADVPPPLRRPRRRSRRICPAWCGRPRRRTSRRAWPTATSDIVIGTHALAGQGRALQGPRPRRDRRGAALRRAPESASCATWRAGRPRPDPDRDAHPAHPASGAGRPAGSSASSPRRRPGARPIRTSLARRSTTPRCAQALVRERRRGGQSFVVCPRIEDIEPMREAPRRRSCRNSRSSSPTASMPPVEIDEAHGPLRRRGRGRAPRHQHHRERARRAARQHHAGLARRPLRPRAAAPAARPRRARPGARRLLSADRPCGDDRRRPRASGWRRSKPWTALGAGFAISARDLDLARRRRPLRRGARPGMSG